MSHPLDPYETPLTDLETAMVAWATEAIDLRFGEAGDPQGRVALPDWEAGQPVMISSLARVRTRLDRIEELQTKAMRARGRLHRMQSEAAFAAQAAYDEAAVQRSAFRSQEYTSAKERNAEASLDSFAQKRAAHLAEKLVAIALEVEEQIKHCYWGLVKLREDHLTLLRRLETMTTEEGMT